MCCDDSLISDTNVMINMDCICIMTNYFHDNCFMMIIIVVDMDHHGIVINNGQCAHTVMFNC